MQIGDRIGSPKSTTVKEKCLKKPSVVKMIKVRLAVISPLQQDQLDYRTAKIRGAIDHTSSEANR